MEINLYGDSVELPDDLIELFEQLEPFQRDLCLMKLTGLKNADAYVMAGGSSKTRAGQRSVACTTLNKPHVKKFMDACERFRFARHIMGRDELAAMYSRLARTDIDDIVEFDTDTENEDGTQRQQTWRLRPQGEMRGFGMKAISEISASKDGLKVKITDKITAGRALERLMGYDSPQRSEITGKDGAPVQTHELTDEEFANSLKDLGIK